MSSGDREVDSGIGETITTDYRELPASPSLSLTPPQDAETQADHAHSEGKLEVKGDAAVEGVDLAVPVADEEVDKQGEGDSQDVEVTASESLPPSPDLLASYDTLDDWTPPQDLGQTQHTAADNSSIKMSDTTESETVSVSTSKIPDLLTSLPADEIDGKLKLDESETEKEVTRKDAPRESLDFSVVALPDTSHLNFELSKHKRTLSKKGSIAHRKKPSRAAIKAVTESSEESRFNDSTEPKPPAPPSSEEGDEVKPPTPQSPLSPHSPPPDSQPLAKKLPGMGGFKIPGLLEGLNKSKSFKRAERSNVSDKDSPVAAAPEKPTLPSKVKASESLTNTSDISPTPSLPTKPKPQPRVLPKPPTSKVLKDTKNQSTARESKNFIADNNDTVNKKPDPFKSGSGLLQELKKKQTDSSTTSTPNVSKSDTKPPLLSAKPSSRPGPPPALKAKPSSRTPPSVTSKPVAPVKPSAKVGTVEAGDTKSDDSSNFAKKRVLPSIGDNKPMHDLTSSVDPNQRKDLRTTSSFRLSPDLGKKDVKATGSFRSVLGPTVASTQTDYRSRLKKNTEGVKTTNSKDVKDAMMDKLKKDSASLSSTEDSNKTGGVDFPKFEENCDSEKSQARPRRKSSVSHVESPLEKEKSSISMPLLSRQSSITGSAYAPIGFKSQMSGAESESKSRSRQNSLSSVEKSSTEVSKSEAIDLSSNVEVSCDRDSDSVFKTTVSNNLETSSNISSSDEPKKSAGSLSLNTEKGDEGSKDETIRGNDQVKEDAKKEEISIKSVPKSSDREEGQSENNKFGVQLRRKEKTPLTPPKEVNKSETSGPAHWRRSLSSNRRSFVQPENKSAPADPDNSPIKWRQNLTSARPASFAEDRNESRSRSDSKEAEAAPKWRENLISNESERSGSSQNISADKSDSDDKNSPLKKFALPARKIVPNNSDKTESKNKTEANETPPPWSQQMLNKKREVPEKDNKLESDSSSNKQDENNPPFNWKQQLSSKRRSFAGTPEKDNKTESKLNDEENKESPNKWRQQLSMKKRSIPEKPVESESNTQSEKNDKDSPVNWRNRLSTRRRPTPDNNTASQESNQSKEEETPNIWRQQLSNKRRSFTPNNVEKPKKDTTPEWLKEFPHRRQQLIDQGILQTEVDNCTDSAPRVE